MNCKKVVQLLWLLPALESCHMYAPPKQSPKGKSAKDVAKGKGNAKRKNVDDRDDALLDALLSNPVHQAAVTKSYEQELIDKFKGLTKFQQDALLHLIFMIRNNQADQALASINGLKEKDLIVLNSQDLTGRTLLMYACEQGSKDVVKMLLDKGANPDFYTKDGITALMFAVKKRDKDITQMLLDKDADLNMKEENGLTALMFAASNGILDIASLLLKKNVRIIDAHDNDGFTALMYATQYNHVEMVRLLINRGANLNQKNTITGATALMIASITNRSEIIGLLLSRGVRLNEQENKGWTALIFGAFKGYVEIVKILLDKGALVNLKNNNGLTAPMIANDSGHENIARMIQEFQVRQLEKKQDKALLRKSYQKWQGVGRDAMAEKEKIKMQKTEEDSREHLFDDLLELEEENSRDLDPIAKLQRELPKVTNWADEWTKEDEQKFLSRNN